MVLPFNYLNPVAVLKVHTLATSQLGNYWSGIAILFLWTGILFRANQLEVIGG